MPTVFRPGNSSSAAAHDPPGPFSREPNQQVRLPFTSSVCMLMGMDNIELYDAAVDGGAEHVEEVA
jgi:hypothetical protein